MLDQNKYAHYLKYAVGEITLVVIDILIAFQVNEWSQNEKNKATKINILTEIISNLAEDSIQLEDMLAQRSIATVSVDRMIAEIPHHSFNLDTFNVDLAHFLTFYEYQKGKQRIINRH